MLLPVRSRSRAGGASDDDGSRDRSSLPRLHCSMIRSFHCGLSLWAYAIRPYTMLSLQAFIVGVCNTPLHDGFVARFIVGVCNTPRHVVDHRIAMCGTLLNSELQCVGAYCIRPQC